MVQASNLREIEQNPIDQKLLFINVFAKLFLNLRNPRQPQQGLAQLMELLASFKLPQRGLFRDHLTLMKIRYLI